MKIEEKTGYPHLDNIHREYYGKKGDQYIDINKSMYRYIKDKSGNFDGIAMTFYNEKISYEELYKNIIKYAKAFYDIGVRYGSRVTFLLPSSPETYYMFYALDIIGARRNMVDLRTSIEGIKKYINETNSEYLICLESYNPKIIKELLNTTELKQVVLSKAPFESIDNDIKRNIGKLVVFVESFGYKKLGNGIYLPDDFIELGKNIDETGIEHECDPEETSLYMHTSGTMKFPKTIMTNDKCQNFVAAQYEKSLVQIDERDIGLAIMPPWILYGIMAFHMPFSMKMNLYPVPDPNNVKFDDLILDIKPNILAGVPNHFIELIESKRVTDKTDLSFCKTFACGGTSINSEKQKEVSKFLKDHGSKYELNPGYSFSENSSIGSVNQGDYIKNGSVGIMMPDVECMIIDQETHKPLKYNETGLICLRGALMNGYLDDEGETNKVLVNLDGKIWAISGDLGYMDEEGFLFIEGREKNVIIGHDGFKIAPNEIEAKISLHPMVKNCVVFGIKDNDYEFGDNPVAYIELRDKNLGKSIEKEIVNEIKKICVNNLSSYYLPRYYYVGEILYTPMMKDDKNAMREACIKELKKNGIKKLILGSKLYK